jgi:hypothetical protein
MERLSAGNCRKLFGEGGEFEVSGHLPRLGETINRVNPKARDLLDNRDPERDTNGMAIARAFSNELQAGTWWRGSILAARWRGW